MINIELKGGVVKEFEAGVSPAEIAKSIGAGLYKAVCCAKINGVTVDLRTPINEDCKVELLTFDDPDGKHAFWHSASHVLAQAVKRLYPNAKCAIGPAIESGFYYDFDVEKPFSQEDLQKIKAEMKKIVKSGLEISRFELPPEEAVAKLEEMGEPYKVELAKEHTDKGENISFYKQGEFVDLCAGPHLMSVAAIKAIELTNCTGAYWRGDANNAQLCRVYGIAFPKASMLEEYLQMLEEARKRDHNKIGRELGFFTTVDYIGQGLPILLPKGARVIQLLQRFVEDKEQSLGWQLTKTPFMAKSDLYKISGHWDHYQDGMFIFGDPESNDEVFALRPMTCPFQYQAYLNKQRSYRDLPLRYNETSTLFRNEASGEMHGLIRVRQFTISEGHLMCTPDQLEEEFKNCVELASYMLKTVGLYEDVSYRFSQWDPNDRAKYIGTQEEWDNVQDMMGKILDHLEIPYEIGIGEAAFYGPKLDIQIKNVYGKEDTLITIQIDTEKIGEVVGKQGKVINRIIEECGVKIDISEDGTVSICGTDPDMMEKARKTIETIVTEFYEGQKLHGKVVTIKEFGAFVEFAPGKEGMVHISKIANRRVDKVEDVLALGDEVDVVCLGKDKMGRFSFSIKDANNYQPRGNREYDDYEGGRSSNKDRNRNKRYDD